MGGVEGGKGGVGVAEVVVGVDLLFVMVGWAFLLILGCKVWFFWV